MAVSTVDIYPSGPLIAMLGNPNAGKTSLFNILTGSKQKVANYAGVTVERVEGQLIGAPEKIRVLDLPGTYSFHPRSPDEKVTVDVLKGIARGERRPDLVVCVLDATNLRRGLKLVMAAQRLKLPAVVAVNMMDLARRRGIELKAEDLSRELGVPVVETIAVRKQGIDRLTELLSDPSAWSSWVPEATEEDDLARLNRILRKLGLDKIFPDEFSDRIDRVVLNPWLHRPLNRRQSLHQGKERIPLWDLWMNSSAWPTPTRMRTRTISRSLSRRLVLPSLSAGTAPSGWTARALCTAPRSSRSAAATRSSIFTPLLSSRWCW